MLTDRALGRGNALLSPLQDNPAWCSANAGLTRGDLKVGEEKVLQCARIPRGDRT